MSKAFGTGSVRIVSDGTVSGTHVYDEAGKEIENVMSVDLHLGVSSFDAVIKLIDLNPKLDITLKEEDVTIEEVDPDAPSS